MNQVVKVKRGQDRKTAIRDDNRVVYFDINTTTLTWQDLSDSIRKAVHERISSNKAMKDIIDESLKDKGSGKQLFFPKDELELPEQAVMIRLGTAYEVGILNCLSARHENLTERIQYFIQRKYKKTKKASQIDIGLGKDGGLLYRELKFNLNLDTGKTESTYERINELVTYLEAFSKEELGVETEIDFGIVSLLYPHASEIIGLKNPLLKMHEAGRIMGYLEFFDVFNIEFTQEDWAELATEIGKEIRESFNRAVDRRNNSPIFGKLDG